MLNPKEIALLACVLGPTSLTAIVAVWRYPRLWWASVGVLATGAAIGFYQPIFFALQTSFGFDWVSYYVLGGFLGVVHLASFGTVMLLLIEKAIERRKARGCEEKK